MQPIIKTHTVTLIFWHNADIGHVTQEEALAHLKGCCNDDLSRLEVEDAHIDDLECPSDQETGLRTTIEWGSRNPRDCDWHIVVEATRDAMYYYFDNYRVEDIEVIEMVHEEYLPDQKDTLIKVKGKFVLDLTETHRATWNDDDYDWEQFYSR